ncbi:hypothetical protein C9426_23520 [Serratia sp. S1B]|nr:hypothetical protein C9426_23520 [Serratia sp. S1B]
MNGEVYGFIINDSIIFNVENRKLICYQDESTDAAFSIKIVSLSETQSRLLSFLLHNRGEDIIDKDNIMESVWDDFGLSSSSQRLWQLVNDLRKKLSVVGVQNDIIINVHGAGYKIDDSQVLSLYAY